MSEPRRAVLCKNCPFRVSSPKAGEPGGSVPAHDEAGMAETVEGMLHGQHIMQCHQTEGRDPRACAGFLSVVGYDALGVRLAVMYGHVHPEDVNLPRDGLYGSLREMMEKANHMKLAALDGRRARRPP